MNDKIIQCFKIPKFSFKPFHISKENKYFIETLYYYYKSVNIPNYVEKYGKTNSSEFGIYYQHIPANILTYIKKQHYDKHLIQFIVNKRRISIHFFTKSKMSKKIIDSTIQIISFISNFASIECSKLLDIYIFNTPFKKEIATFDNNRIERKDINSAYTFSCYEKNSIYIFRKEEWKKVLIHECIHAFGIDFSTIETDHADTVNAKLDNIFNLGINYKFNEAYCETLATIITSIDLFRSQKENTEIIPFMETHLTHEIIHSLVQSNKYLKHSSLSMRHLVFGKDNSTYSENTSAFSYYFIKSLFLYNINSFLKITHSISNHTLKNSFTPKNIIKYIDLIHKTAYSNDFKNDMKLADKLISQCPLLHKSMKFSFYG